VKQSKGEPKRGSGGWRRLSTSKRSHCSIPEWHQTEVASAKCSTGLKTEGRCGGEPVLAKRSVRDLTVSNEMGAAKTRACNLEQTRCGGFQSQGVRLEERRRRNEAERAKNRSGRWRRGGASETRCLQQHLNIVQRHNGVKPGWWGG
jgi:hypothetical protein